MRTNIDIDDRLMRQAMRSSRSRTKRAAVEAGLRLLIQTRAQANIRIDCFIATFCLRNGHSLLHRDRDFDHFEKFLGLTGVHPG